MLHGLMCSTMYSVHIHFMSFLKTIEYTLSDVFYIHSPQTCDMITIHPESSFFLNPRFSFKYFKFLQNSCWIYIYILYNRRMRKMLFIIFCMQKENYLKFYSSFYILFNLQWIRIFHCIRCGTTLQLLLKNYINFYLKCSQNMRLGIMLTLCR